MERAKRDLAHVGLPKLSGEKTKRHRPVVRRIDFAHASFFRLIQAHHESNSANSSSTIVMAHVRRVFNRER